MPPRIRKIAFPAWAEALEDECLHSIVREALVARHAAIRLGAERAGAVVRRQLAAADKTLDAVEFGTAKGLSAACSKASVAVRKYTNVVDRLSEVAERAR